MPDNDMYIAAFVQELMDAVANEIHSKLPQFRLAVPGYSAEERSSGGWECGGTQAWATHILHRVRLPYVRPLMNARLTNPYAPGNTSPLRLTAVLLKSLWPAAARILPSTGARTSATRCGRSPCCGTSPPPSGGRTSRSRWAAGAGSVRHGWSCTVVGRKRDDDDGRTSDQAALKGEGGRQTAGCGPQARELFVLLVLQGRRPAS